LDEQEQPWGSASHLGSRLSPPAPLTGDVGRGCGDASRALLFSFSLIRLIPIINSGPARIDPPAAVSRAIDSH
jgi:hypothetical protein